VILETVWATRQMLGTAAFEFSAIAVTIWDQPIRSDSRTLHR